MLIFYSKNIIWVIKKLFLRYCSNLNYLYFICNNYIQNVCDIIDKDMLQNSEVSINPISIIYIYIRLKKYNFILVFS